MTTFVSNWLLFDYFYLHLFTLIHTCSHQFYKWNHIYKKTFQPLFISWNAIFQMVVPVGIEPTTSGLWARRATRLLYPAIFNSMAEELGFEPRRQFPDLPVFKTGPFNHLGIPPSFYFFGGPCRTRTYDPPVMSRMLWPTELRVLLANWWRGRDSNSRPSGYEPDALAN